MQTRLQRWMPAFAGMTTVEMPRDLEPDAAPVARKDQAATLALRAMSSIAAIPER